MERNYGGITASGYDQFSEIDLQRCNNANAPLQKWIISPAEDFTLVNITYSIDPDDLVNQKPDFFCLL